MLFQYELYDIVNILRFIVIILQVIGAVGLIIVGSSKIRISGPINNSIVFTIGGLIVAIFLVINERILFLISGVVGSSVPHFYEDLYPIFRYSLFEITPNVVLLIVFGVLFLFLGIKNKEKYGKLLMISGIFWCVFGVISIVSNSIIILRYIHSSFFLYTFVLSMQFLVSITSIFTIISSVFFLIYAVKIKVKILLGSSIVLLVASNIIAVNSLFQLIIYIL